MRKNYGLSIAIVSMILLVLGNVSNGDIVAKGLVAYWSLDANTIKGDNVSDIVGKNDGVMKGKPKQAGGKINEALEFDGSNSVDINGTDALNFNGKDELTVCAWVNAKNAEPVAGVVAGCCGTIIAQRDANGWALRFDGRNANSEFEFIVCPNWQGDGGFGATKNKVKPGEWHYLTGVVAKKVMRLYLDGEMVVEGPFSGPITSNGPETEIGHAGDGGFIGVIDEVAIYNRALDDNEIKQNYESKRFFAVDLRSKLTTCWGNIKYKDTEK